MDVLWGALAAVIGAVIGFFADIGKARLGEKAERQRAIRERSDKAAEDLVPLLDDARACFSNAYQHGSGPDYEDLQPVLVRIRQKAILLGDADVRREIETAVEVWSGYSGVEQLLGERPSRIAYLTWNEAREALARSLNDQPFAASDLLKQYREAVEEHHANLAEMMEKDRKRRLAQADDE